MLSAALSSLADRVKVTFGSVVIGLLVIDTSRHLRETQSSLQ